MDILLKPRSNFLLLGLLFCNILFSRGQIIIDKENDTPIANAIVSTDLDVVVTDKDGVFYIQCSDSILVQHINYETSKFPCGDNHYKLKPKNQFIEEIVIKPLTNIELLEIALKDFQEKFDYTQNAYLLVIDDNKYQFKSFIKFISEKNGNFELENTTYEPFGKQDKYTFPLIKFYYSFYYASIFEFKKMYSSKSLEKKYKDLEFIEEESYLEVNFSYKKRNITLHISYSGELLRAYQKESKNYKIEYTHNENSIFPYKIAFDGVSLAIIEESIPNKDSRRYRGVEELQELDYTLIAD